MAASPQPPRLNTPGRRSGWLPRTRWSSDVFGEFAEGFARWMGTAQFLVWMTIFVIVWVSINLIGLFGLQWDPYPFILLNLFFSTQASYSAPLILLAQNRQEARDRVSLENDRQVASQSRADMDFLARELASLRMRINDMPSRDFIRSELRDLLEDLNRADGECSERDDEPKGKRRSREG